MDVKLTITGLGKIKAFANECGPSGRRHLYQVGANALAESVRRHLRSVAPSRHRTAERLGAKRTMHYENAVAAVAPCADANHGEVVVPIAGISRAYQDLDITPVNASYLTLPLAAESYGHTAREMESRGWRLFRPKGKNILMGTKGRGKDAVTKTLFALKKKVHQQKDPALLPTQADATKTFVAAVAEECRRIIRKASAK